MPEQDPIAGINQDIIDSASVEEMASPLWRIRNIYTIQSATATGDDAGPIPFVPTPEQNEVLDAIYVKGWERIIILKSRQLGLSTLICIVILDNLLFGSGVQCSIIDEKQTAAQKKLSSKIKYAWEALGSDWRSAWKTGKSNESEFSVNAIDGDDSTACTVYAELDARGGTNHFLFISEWGEIQKSDPGRSAKILNGALPTAAHPGCITIVETTWKGGKAGELWPLVAEAMKPIPEDHKSPKDWRLMFFGWWTNPKNRDFGRMQITTKTNEYCDDAEKQIGRKLDKAQRLWWQKTKIEQGIFMSSQHPSTLRECLESPTEGAYFDGVGLQWQEEVITPLETSIKYIDITLQEGESHATWQVVDENLAPFMMLEPPIPGERYILWADFGIGQQVAGSSGKRDTNAFGITKDGRIDPSNGEVRLPTIVCSCRADDQTGTTETIRRIKLLYFMYGQCMTVPEINNKDDIALRLIAAGVTNIWKQKTVGADGAMAGKGKTNEVFGWFTSGDRHGGGTRKQILDHVQHLTKQQGWICGFQHILHQHKVFIVDKSGKPQAASGERDDFVMGPAIGLFCLPSATTYYPPESRIYGRYQQERNDEEFDPAGV